MKPKRIQKWKKTREKMVKIYKAKVEQREKTVCVSLISMLVLFRCVYMWRKRTFRATQNLREKRMYFIKVLCFNAKKLITFFR